MFTFINHWVMSAGAWGAAGFFCGAFIEEFVFFVPSPLLLIGATFFFGKPLSAAIVLKMFWLVILPIVLGASAASFIIFVIAYAGGKAAVEKLSKWHGFSWDDVERIRTKLSRSRSDEGLLFLSRALPFSPSAIFTVAAGVVRMNPATYFVITLLGIFIRVAGLFVGALALGGAIIH